jgi:choline dehydrogenase-like flavoprotein
MLAALKAVDKFVSADVWKGYILNRWGPYADATTDELLIEYARNNTATYVLKDLFLSLSKSETPPRYSIWHPTSTARMSPAAAPWGVVDSRLKVKKVSGIRIVDASIFP